MRPSFSWGNTYPEGTETHIEPFCASGGISQGCKPSPGTRSDWSMFKAAHDTDNGHSSEGAISAPFFLSLRRYERPCEIRGILAHDEAQRRTEGDVVNV